MEGGRDALLVIGYIRFQFTRVLQRDGIIKKKPMVILPSFRAQLILHSCASLILQFLPRLPFSHPLTSALYLHTNTKLTGFFLKNEVLH